MEQNNRHKTFYIVLSVLGALLIWFFANISTEVSVTVSDIPVEFLNEETTLADKGFMLIRGDEEVTVDLELRMTRSYVYRLDKEKIRVLADLSQVNSTGPQSINYTIVYPNNILASAIKVDSPVVRSLNVEIGELFRKEVEIRCKVVGSVAEGYIAGTVQMLPELLEIRGQQVDIMQVNYAQVTLNVENATSTIVELLDFELYDFSDQLIDSGRIHPASDSIQVTMPVMTVKEVPLVVEFIETPGSRLKNVTWELSVDSITLSGDASTLSTIDQIVLDTLALEDLQTEETFVYTLEIPEGVYNLSGVTSTTLTITFNHISSREMEVIHFGYENLSSEREVTIVTSTLPVVFRGTSSDLERLTQDNIRAVADLSNVSDADGVYAVMATIYVDDGIDVGAVGTYQLTVRLSAPSEVDTE